MDKKLLEQRIIEMDKNIDKTIALYNQLMGRKDELLDLIKIFEKEEKK